MANDKAYNGWHNYETWAVKLWMDNEEPSYRYGESIAQEAWDDTDDDRDNDERSHVARMTIADRLKDEYEEAMPELDGVFSDLLSAALGEVDWFEIADALLNDEELDGYESRK